MWYGTTITKPGEESFWSQNRNTFVSIEPILARFTNMEENLCDLSWVIIGAETGRRKGKIVPEREWIEDIVNECKEKNIPVFMKFSLADIWGEPLIQEFPVGLQEIKRD